MNKYLFFLLFFVAGVFLSGCTGDSFFRRTEALESDYWVMGRACTFEVEVEDTSVLYDVYVDLRTSDGYPWSKIYIAGELKDSISGAISRDTLECVLSDVQGVATGRGLSNVKENAILWKKDFKFPHKGIYALSLSHCMRNVELPGVSSVGVRIEYAGTRRE